MRAAPMLALLTIVCRTRSEQQLADRPEPMRDQAPSVRLHLMTIERRSDVTDIRVRAWLAGEPSMGSNWSCLRHQWWVGERVKRVGDSLGVCDGKPERMFEDTISFRGERATIGLTLWDRNGHDIATGTIDVAR